MATLDSGYLASPANADSPVNGAAEIRSTRSEFEQRLDQEHVMLGTTSTGESVHKAGSARAYYQASTPTLRPDGTTSLGINDTGRIFVDSDDSSVWIWDGTAMVEASTAAAVQATYSTNVGATGSGNYITPKIINIGAWNLKNDTTLAVLHGLSDITKIVSVTGVIMNDDGTEGFSLGHGLIIGGESQVYIYSISTTHINLACPIGGSFTNTDYDGAGNRGYLTVWYKT
jgi:hypothetical protein